MSRLPMRARWRVMAIWSSGSGRSRFSTFSTTFSSVDSAMDALWVGMDLLGKPAGKLRGGNLAAPGGILARPQRREVSAPGLLRRRAQRRDGRAGQRKLGRERIDGPQLAHEAVHDPARRAAGEEVGERGVARAFALQCRAMHRARRRLRA